MKMRLAEKRVRMIGETVPTGRRHWQVPKAAWMAPEADRPAELGRPTGEGRSPQAKAESQAQCRFKVQSGYLCQGLGDRLRVLRALLACVRYAPSALPPLGSYGRMPLGTLASTGVEGARVGRRV